MDLFKKTKQVAKLQKNFSVDLVKKIIEKPSATDKPCKGLSEEDCIKIDNCTYSKGAKRQYCREKRKKKDANEESIKEEPKDDLSKMVKIVDSTKLNKIDRKKILEKIKNAEPKEKSLIKNKKPKKVKQIKLKSKKSKTKVGIKASITETEAPKKTVRITAQQDGDTLKKEYFIDKKLIEQDRLPKAEPIVVHASNYYLNNRTIFTQFINSLFKELKEELELEKKIVNCDKDDNFNLLIHQKIVRDYINLYTPYRGLLLYHGLGSGKTCSSIAIAEGLKTQKTVIVMTPAALRSNYIKELKFCGDKLYKKKQYWEFVKASSDKDIEILSQILSLNKDLIKKNNGCWLVDVKKESNYDNLSSEEKKQLDLQLDAMIMSKYKFINYNGLRQDTFNKLTNDYTTNIFDNNVVIIDEAHNFVSRIVNKLKVKDALSVKIYEMLMSATNCKIILLSGTPIINYPNELAVLFNILRGYIKTWKIELATSKETKLKKVDEKNIKKLIHSDKELASILDYIDYKANKRELIFTKNPFKFSGDYTPKYKGVHVVNNEQLSDHDILDKLENLLKKNGIIMNRSSLKIDSFTALPDSFESFTNIFINANSTLKYKTLFQKRIMGLTSYFPDLTQLMPRFNKLTDIHVIKIPMSDYQLSQYEEIRQEERKQSKPKKKKKNINNLYKESTSTYRIFSRAACNFVFPEGKRPKPNNKFAQNETDIDNNNDETSSDNNYNEQLVSALKLLEDNGREFLSDVGLQKYSPKFLNILENLQDPKYKGLHLIYSQFRTLEGIGILRLVLLYNGFKEFKLKKDQNGLWTCDIDNDKQPRFALYTGTEEEEEKELMRNIYNGDWELIPSSLRTQLNNISTDNKLGEIIKIFMITSSGAEGINLKNTRYVHITEPYWHPVRIEQVIGRARRICSHYSLPNELQTVEVFIYLMTITNKQLETASKELLLKDKSDITKKVVTSDEMLYEISNKKAAVNDKLLTAIKEASMDCFLHSSSENPLKCYTIANPDSNKFNYVPDLRKESSYKSEKSNLEKITWTAKNIKFTDPLGIKHVYAWNEHTNKVYTIDSYNGALKGLQTLEQVGDMVPLEGGKYKFIALGL